VLLGQVFFFKPQAVKNLNKEDKLTTSSCIR